MIAEARALALIRMHSSQKMRPPGMCRHNNLNALVTPHVPATPLPFREWRLATWRAVCTKNGPAHRGDGGGPDKEAPGAEIGSAHLHRCQVTRRGGSTAKLGGAMSSLRPRQAGPQSVSLVPALKLGAEEQNHSGNDGTAGLPHKPCTSSPSSVHPTSTHLPLDSWKCGMLPHVSLIVQCQSHYPLSRKNRGTPDHPTVDATP